jgi:hypothetical protein
MKEVRSIRETGEGWPSADYSETEANGDSRSTYMYKRGSSFVGFLVPVQEIFVLPWLL